MIRFLTLLVVLLGSSTASWTFAADKRPNIVLIMVDDMGFSDLGCYGGEIRTPNIDRLAAEGVRFSRFYNSSRCCPTRASLMTGLHPHRTGIRPHDQSSAAQGVVARRGAGLPQLSRRPEPPLRDACRNARSGRLRDLHRRQVAPRFRPAGVLAAAAWLRSLLRVPVRSDAVLSPGRAATHDERQHLPRRSGEHDRPARSTRPMRSPITPSGSSGTSRPARRGRSSCTWPTPHRTGRIRPMKKTLPVIAARTWKAGMSSVSGGTRNRSRWG